MSSELEKVWKSEDYWAIWFSVIILAGAVTGLVHGVPKLRSWVSNPLEAVDAAMLAPLVLLAVGLGALLTLGVRIMGEPWRRFLAGYLVIFGFAVASFVAAGQESVNAVGLEYALWALAFGLLVANTVGTPDWLLAGAKSEMFIKTGLVLLGAEILFSEILRLGAPGLIVAWVVTPTVIVFMWLFGTRWLKMPSKTLTIIIATATSVCGVSAAIATAAACRAKKQELTLAVGMTMIFTVLMMVFMPAIAKLVGMQAAVAGAWLGGTIDSTGAVVAAGALLGEEAERVAAVIKMIQNILIGLVAFFVALFWVARVDRDPSAPRPSLMEVWYRFPKFILGFALASVFFSFVLMPMLGEARVAAILDTSKVLRGWLFCLAFVAIGLESNFKELASQLVGGKPIILYVVGQSFNILLTLLAAWLVFGGILFAAGS
ncbi:MAG TPA: putative sulfate exporter family transporter [Methylomirabilota bacterium]|nr:putative sulfate exporter family transporter [Methylomirabilota bacterium]